MTPEQKLNNILTYLDNDNVFPEIFEEIKINNKLNLNDKELHLVLEKLCKDDYVSFNYITKNELPSNEKVFYISFGGRVFLNRGGYVAESKSIKRIKCWTNFKTIAAILNATIIIVIGIASVKVAQDSKNKDEKISSLELKVDSLQTIQNIENIQRKK
ncbi:MAG: hypothetical protein Q7U47_15045 [Paludibacter sp.]|nr:hypothetical protein [Paludibacter sp.]